MSKKHRGRFKGDPVTYQLPNPAGGVQLETFVPWTLVKRVEEAGHHALGRAAGISVRSHPGAGSPVGRAGHRVDAGARTGAPLATPSG